MPPSNPPRPPGPPPGPNDPRRRPPGPGGPGRLEGPPPGRGGGALEGPPPGRGGGALEGPPPGRGPAPAPRRPPAGARQAGSEGRSGRGRRGLDRRDREHGRAAPTARRVADGDRRRRRGRTHRASCRGAPALTASRGRHQHRGCPPHRWRCRVRDVVGRRWRQREGARAREAHRAEGHHDHGARVPARDDPHEQRRRAGRVPGPRRDVGRRDQALQDDRLQAAAHAARRQHEAGLVAGAAPHPSGDRRVQGRPADGLDEGRRRHQGAEQLRDPDQRVAPLPRVVRLGQARARDRGRGREAGDADTAREVLHHRSRRPAVTTERRVRRVRAWASPRSPRCSRASTAGRARSRSTATVR